jgi:hypothetical protein
MFVQVLSTIESIAASESCDISEKTLSTAVSAILAKQPMHQKGASDTARAYLTCLGAVMRKLHGVSPSAVEAQLPEVFSRVSDFMLPVDGDEAAVAAANLMCDLIDVCVRPPFIRDALQVPPAPTPLLPPPFPAPPDVMGGAWAAGWG